MSHAHLPFILAAYGAFALIMGWCALAPLFRRSRIRRQIEHYHQYGNHHDSQP